MELCIYKRVFLIHEQKSVSKWENRVNLGKFKLGQSYCNSWVIQVVVKYSLVVSMPYKAFTNEMLSYLLKGDKHNSE